MRATLAIVACSLCLLVTPAACKDPNAKKGEEKHVHQEDPVVVKNPQVKITKNKTGKTVTHAGRAFSAAPKVLLSDLTAKPESFVGKKVTIEGNISTMCFHRRSWFALVGDDLSGAYVRVVTAPEFLVPQGSVGKSAKVEGKVELGQMSAQRARYLAKQHQLGDPDKIDGPIKLVVLRASGADFF